MTITAEACIDAEIAALQAEQNVLRAQVAALDAPIAALARVKRALAGEQAEPAPKRGRSGKTAEVRHERADAGADVQEGQPPTHFPGTNVPVRTALDAEEAQRMLERLEAEGR